MSSGWGKYGSVKSIAEAIIIAFSIVPIPGTCFKGIQKIRMAMLIKKVAIPIERSDRVEMPCAKTVQGLTPEPLPMIIASPKPNKKSPIINMIIVLSLGLVFSGNSELQLREGTALIEKILLRNLMALINYGLNWDKCSLL